MTPEQENELERVRKQHNQLAMEMGEEQVGTAAFLLGLVDSLRSELEKEKRQSDRIFASHDRLTKAYAKAFRELEETRKERDEATGWLRHIEGLMVSHRDRKPGNVLLMIRDALQAAFAPDAPGLKPKDADLEKYASTHEGKSQPVPEPKPEGHEARKAFVFERWDGALREMHDKPTATPPESWTRAWPEFSLRHLQEHLPWSLPYSIQFEQSQGKERHRNLTHDLLHVFKSMGKVAAVAERIDHGDYSRLDKAELAKNVADLVICALHIAKTNPAGEFDLAQVVVSCLESRNQFTYPPERAISSSPTTPEAK